MEQIGNIIRNHRIAKGMTQEELGSKVFVSKQAVSKWETGKTLPDIEMLRKLCDILEVNKDEILGSSIEQTKKSRKWFKVCVTVSVICILAALFFGLDGFEYLDRHTQSGIGYLTVFSDGELLLTEDYQVSGNMNFVDLKNGYSVDVDYGEVRGTLRLSDQHDVEFGFINTNNWHNIHIRLDIQEENGKLFVKQTVSYKTDNDIYEVIVSEGTTTEKALSVFREGL